MRAVLLRDNPDISALLATLCHLADLPLAVVDSIEDLLLAAQQAGPHDFLIVDCSHDRYSGIERGLRIATRTAVPIQLMHPREAFVHELTARALGPVTWLPPDFPALTTLEKMRRLRAAPATAGSPDPAPALLSAREREIFRLVGIGHSDEEIARAVALSPNTVKTHVRHIKDKLGIARRAALIAAYRTMQGG